MKSNKVIICTECGNRISGNKNSCPRCGSRYIEYSSEDKKKGKKPPRKEKWNEY